MEQHNPRPITQQSSSLLSVAQDQSSATAMQRHRQATGTKQGPFNIGSDHEPLDGPRIYGMIGSNKGRQHDGEPSPGNSGDGRGKDHYLYDGGHRIRRYDGQEEDKDSHSNLTITDPDAHNTDQEEISTNAANQDDNPFFNSVESSGWTVYADHQRPATPSPQPRSFAAEAFQTTSSQARIMNRLETTTGHTSPCSSSSSFEALLYPCFIRGVEQVEDKDIAAILEERKKQIADEGNNHEQQFAELRQRLIAHFEGFLEVSRQLQELQAKALDRAKRAEKVEALQEDLPLLDSEHCPN
ncbi:hypothetical protein BDW75DRAFT_245442 [Aspergillus navahoensis]